MSDLAGRLNIALHRDDVTLGVTIASSRPLAAPGVFVGRGVRETAQRLPGLFCVCATAQASACAQAIEQALGLTPDPLTASRRQALVDAEAVKEHLWRLLLEWPRLLGEVPAAAAMREVMQAWGGLRRGVGDTDGAFVPGGQATRAEGWAAGLARLARVAAAEVFGAPAEVWLARVATPDDFVAWAEDAGTSAARLVLGVLRAGEADLGSCVVEALPDLQPSQVETGQDLRVGWIEERNPALEPSRPAENLGFAPLIPAHREAPIHRPRILAQSHLADRLSGPGASAFVARPDWGGTPRETSPFTRTRYLDPVVGLVLAHGNGLLARQAAVLVEVATLLTRLQAALDDGPGTPRCETGTGIGVAQVQAARGLLVHRVELDRADMEGGLVRDYRILAPTEWNFHPQGVVARGLATLSPRTDELDLRRQAGLFVTLVDPCVDYLLSVV